MIDFVNQDRYSYFNKAPPVRMGLSRLSSIPFFTAPAFRLSHCSDPDLALAESEPVSPVTRLKAE